MNNVRKNEIIGRIEYIIGYLLSKKYDADVKVHLKKDEITNDDTNKTRDI